MADDPTPPAVAAASAPAPDADSNAITHPLQALPDMQPEPSPLKDGVIWVGIMFGVTALLALLICHRHPDMFSSFIATSGMVHGGAGAGIAGNRAWSKTPYNNASKQPLSP